MSIASAVGSAVRAVSHGTRASVHHSSGGGIAHAVNSAVRTAVRATGRGSGVPHAGRYIARGRRSYARGVARQRSAQRQAARSAQRQEVRRAQNEVLKALKAKPKKLPPFRLVDPITKQGRRSTSKSIQKLTRKGATTLVASNKPYVPKPKVIYDQKSHALFHYRQPSAQTVQSNVRKLFKGNPNQRGQAVARLRAMGVVTGGKPSQRYFKYVGHLTPTVGAINNRQGLSEHVASLSKSGPPDQGIQHYKGTTLQGKPFVAVSAPGRPITMVQGQVGGAQIAHDIGKVTHFIAHGGASPTYEATQASLLPAPARALRRGVLSGTHKALGFAGEYLNRPLAAGESLLAHGLVDAGLIKGNTARKIRRSRGPLTAFLHGQRRQDVHGGDITQGLFKTRKLGIVADVALDPTMWVGAAAAPETGGSSALLALERIGSRGGKAAEALRSDRILALTNQAHKTGEYKHLNVALKDIAKQHHISLRNLKGYRGRRLLKDLNRADTRALLHDLHGQKAVTISGKRGLTRRVLRRQAPQRQLHVVGKPGLDAVTSIAKTVHAQRIRPGLRLQAMTPLGRRIGRPLDLPLPKKLANAKLLPIASQRQRERLRLQTTQQIESKYRALHEQQVAPLLAQREAARLAGDVGAHNKLDAAVHEVSSALDVARTAELKKARMIPTQSLRSITDRANATRLQRQTSQFAQSYGRTVKHRLDEAVLKATQTEGLSAKAATVARQRVQLHLWEQEATGSTAVLDRVMPLTPQEQRIKVNLEHVYADSFRQAKEVGILDRGVPNYGGTRIWNDKGLDPTNPTQVESVVQGLEASRGMNSAFTHHRSAASVFDLASPAQVAHQIKKLSKVPLTDAEATHLANELWHTGHSRLHTELIARDLERGATVDFNKLSSQQQRHVINATRMTPPGQANPVPLFHVAQPGAEIRKVTLNPAAERHYNFSPTAYEGLSAESARAAKLKSALNDRNRVADILTHTTATGDHLKALEAAHVMLNNRVSALDRSVTSLPQSVQDAIAATHGVEGAPGYVKVPATEANRHGQAMVDELAARMDKIQAHAAAAPAANGDMAHQLELKLLRNDFAKARARLDPQINKAFQEHMILRQSGGNGLSPGLMHSAVLNDANVLYVVPEGVKAPAGLPMPRFAGEPGPFDDVLDYGNRLPDFREPDLLPVLDPKLSNFYRTRAQARMSAFQARWHGIDEAVGRSTSEVTAGTLVRRGRDYFYDPQTHTEYKLAEVNGGTPPGIAPDRVWPTQVIQDAKAEQIREGAFDGIVRTGIESGTERMLATFRYGFTTPFPAFHLRNFITDLLKSLQADPGVIFHPITNVKLLLAAGGVKHHLMIRVPGHGRIPVEDFLLLSETIGVRSGHHVSELLQGAGKAAWSESRIRRFLTKAGVGPNSFFGHMATGFGVKREDVMRFNTFVQRMRRNGGNAADAAMYMIQHHFNYNDLSAVERRFARNTFLFYTWYRKNIPLQLMELVRRPGFFSAISSTYNDLQRGETPINQDWSQISPWLPDMSGEFPQVSTIPDYYKDSLSAAPLPWNGHAVMVGFGAPWADLQILSKQGPRQLLGMTQPAIGVLYQLFAKQDILTGRSFAASEPGGLANTLNGVLGAFGTSLPKDKYGNAILPFWANVLGNSVPILGRGAGAARGMSPFTDQGQLQTLGKRYSWLTGANVYVSPKPGSVRYNAAVQQIVKGRAAERGKLIYDLRNLPKHDLRKALHKFDKQTHVWAKDKHISSSVLKKVQRSGFYQGSRSSGSSKPGLTIPKSGGGAGGLTIPKAPSGSAPLIIPGGGAEGMVTPKVINPAIPKLAPLGKLNPKAVMKPFDLTSSIKSTVKLASGVTAHVAGVKAPHGHVVFSNHPLGHKDLAKALDAFAGKVVGTAAHLATATHGMVPSQELQQFAKHGVSTSAGGTINLSPKEAKHRIGLLHELGFGNGQIVDHLTAGKTVKDLGQPAQLAAAASVLKHVKGTGSPIPMNKSHYTPAEISKIAQHYGAPKWLADALGNTSVPESGGNPNAYNASTATGLLQVQASSHPDIAKGGNLHNPEYNVRSALHILSTEGSIAWSASGTWHDRAVPKGMFNFPNPAGQPGKPWIKLNAKQKAAVKVVQRIAHAWRNFSPAGGSGPVRGGIFADKAHSGRIDMGWDVTGAGPVTAFASGHVTRSTTASSWPGHGMIAVKLDKAIHTGGKTYKYMFYAENIQPQVHVGQHVKAGQPLAHARGVYPFTEQGFAIDPYGTTAAASYYHEGQVTPDGQRFYNWAHSKSKPGKPKRGQVHLPKLAKADRKLLNRFAPVAPPAGSPSSGGTSSGGTSSGGGGSSSGGGSASGGKGSAPTAPTVQPTVTQADLNAIMGGTTTSDPVLDALLNHQGGKALLDAILNGISSGSYGSSSLKLPPFKLHV